MMICLRCKIPKEDDQFSWRSKIQQIKNNECKECINKYATIYREKNKDKIRFTNKRYSIEHKYELAEHKKELYRNNREYYLQRRKEYYQNNIEKNRRAAREYSRQENIKKKQIINNKQKSLKLKIEVYNAYGGAFCICCNESEIKFLTIDHINGCKPGQRKAEGTGTVFYRFLIKNNFPSGYQ